ncbi:MAG TPA: hypothetical protein VFO22_09735 [Candidatus Udaeobacter sp.]|nr:hypothetical protein [Candidatus Udaeobacter sp.]
MSLPDKIKAIVLTCDRYRAVTEHMIFQYGRLWPDHPFVFHVPYQELGGVDTEQVKYLTAPWDIKGTVLHLLTEIDDEEWIYWCVDDKYPIQLVTDKIGSLISHAMRSPGVDGLLFCRCRATLNNPKLTLYPRKVKNPFGDIYFERKAWFQIWIHQILRAKVLRHLFTQLPDDIPSAKAMDELKNDVPKLPEHRLFVTKQNFAVFGESTSRGVITQNCYESMVAAGIEIPEWFHHPNGEYMTLGKL